MRAQTDGGANLRRKRTAAMFSVLFLALAGMGWRVAPAVADMNDPLDTRLSYTVVKAIFPDFDSVGDMQGDPPIVKVFRGEDLLGYLFSTNETANPRGYSGESFDIIVGMDPLGRIKGAQLIEEHEPMIAPGLIPVAALQKYFETLDNADITAPVRSQRGRGVDGVRGATISATLMHGGILLSARRIARDLGLIKGVVQGGLAVDLDSLQEQDWPSLLESGAVAGLRVGRAQFARDVAEKTSSGVGTFRPPADGDAEDDLLAEIYVALATPAAIGRNLFGPQWYSHHRANLNPGEQMVAILGRGPYSWRGKAHYLQDVFDRVQIVQGDKTFLFARFNALSATAIRVPGAPRFDEVGLFKILQKDGFDPVLPWRMELLVESEAKANSDEVERVVYSLPYRLPGNLVIGDDYALEEAGLKEPVYHLFGLFRESTLTDWQREWVGQAGKIAALVALLTALTAILVGHERLSRRRWLHKTVRLTFLGVVLVWLGWIAGAQLTIINAISYFQTLIRGLDWTVLLMEPLIFLLVIYTVVSLVLLGRGVFCGWLCPFGALQELTAQLARWFRVPQFSLPFSVNERLWPLRYIIAAAVLVVAIFSMESASVLAEVEPFKTAITVKFDRAWPYAVYAGMLVIIGLFVERAFCRFLCPLGGLLAALGRFHMFDWLKRRPECGSPCHVCETSCPVQAIAPTGKINMNECFQCFDCIVDFCDDGRCPPLIKSRKALARVYRGGPLTTVKVAARGS